MRTQAPLTLPQVDFAASMALLLGVPIPFGSIGRLSRELWLLSGQSEAATTFCAALSVNAWQARPMAWTGIPPGFRTRHAEVEAAPASCRVDVPTTFAQLEYWFAVVQVHRYLNEYAAAGTALPVKLLARSNALFAAALAASPGSTEQEARCCPKVLLACEAVMMRCSGAWKVLAPCALNAQGRCAPWSASSAGTLCCRGHLCACAFHAAQVKCPHRVWAG